ncbi:hypothetical protein [Sinorhizobium meliloti]|uniref:hypothetical protein n=1 Tax=Rhizobium meliloti TaxID=382 RepID=UPI000FD89BB3|nr:hypothetical protein [Sinorhizobium meliloti]RVM91493.1 hypothetical protein CN122_14970 [Sinorhizobium meliloti]
MADAEAPTMIARFAWKLDTGFDDEICDEVCVDRLTGQEVVRYDAGDPANHNPAYGGWSKREYLARAGCDPDAEIDISQSKVTVSLKEAENHAFRKAAIAQREQEEAEAADLLDFLGDDASAFDFDDYRDGECDILAPALEKRGFTNVGFYMIEQDSFGPLVRGCRAVDPTGKSVRFFYG